jgi:uncharacterized membrane protein YhiD involved in acid resistance
MELDTLLIRLTITFVFSLLYGVARQYSHKPIGFGTFTFVATGSCALAITSLRMAAHESHDDRHSHSLL